MKSNERMGDDQWGNEVPVAINETEIENSQINCLPESIQRPHNY